MVNLEAVIVSTEAEKEKEKCIQGGIRLKIKKPITWSSQEQK